MSQIQKAVLLAAGMGQRLHPLTTNCPKPLLPFMGVPLLALILKKLEQAGITQVAINLHYLPTHIEQYLDTHPSSMSIHLSFEPTLLGTAGVYRPLQAWRQDEPLFVHNGDVLTDFSFAPFLQGHQDTKWATMGLLAHENPTEKNQIGQKNQRVISAGPVPIHRPTQTSYHGFSCVHTLSTQFLETIQKSPHSSILPLYQEALDRGEWIEAHIHPDSFWFDLGTPQSYWDAHERFFYELEHQPENPFLHFVLQEAQNRGFTLLHNTSQGGVYYEGYNLVHESAQLAPTCHIGPHVVITQGCIVGAYTRLDNTILLPNSHPSHAKAISHQILTPFPHEAPIFIQGKILS